MFRKICNSANGILLSHEILETFLNLNISIGVSIDGTKEANDKYRIDFKGQSTFDSVLNGINLLNTSRYSQN